MLARKLVVPEVYDLMGQVQALMIRSQAATVRQACSTVRPKTCAGYLEPYHVLRGARNDLLRVP